MSGIISDFGHEFKYYLLDKQGNYYVAGGGVSTKKTPLVYTPDGWQEKSLQFERDKTFWGVTRSFAIGLGFVNDGAEIIRGIYYANGVNSYVHLIIERLDRDTLTYSTYYEADGDFTTFEDDKEDYKCTLSFIDSSFVQKIKDKADTDYEIPLLKYGARVVNLKGITLENRAQAIMLDNYTDNTYTRTTGYPPDLGTHSVGLQWTDTTEVNVAKIEDVDRKRVKNANASDMVENEITPFLTTNIATNVVIEWDTIVEFSNLLTGVMNYRLQVVELYQGGLINRSVIDAVDYYFTTAPVRLRRHLKGKTTISKTANSSLYLMGTTNQMTSAVKYTVAGYDAGTFTISEIRDKAPATECLALDVDDVFQELCKKIHLNGGLMVKNTGLPTVFKVMLTTGNAIRRLDNPKLKISINTLYKAIDTAFNVGMNISSSGLTIRHKRECFNKNLFIMDIGEVRNLVIKPALDWIYSDIKVGYKKNTYNDVNGKYEFNNTTTFTTPANVNKTLDIVSPIRADGYGIEFIRINLDGKPTTDDEGDDDIFMLIVNNQPTRLSSFDLYRDSNLAYVTGVIAPDDVFNLDISPKNNLLRYGSVLHAGLDGMDNDVISYQTMDKDVPLVQHFYTPSGVTLAEQTDEPIDNLLPPLFRPFIFEFETDYPNNSMDTLTSAEDGYISFKYKGSTYKGFILNVEIAPASREAKKWTLICHPEQEVISLNK